MDCQRYFQENCEKMKSQLIELNINCSTLINSYIMISFSWGIFNLNFNLDRLFNGEMLEMFEGGIGVIDFGA